MEKKCWYPDFENFMLKSKVTLSRQWSFWKDIGITNSVLVVIGVQMVNILRQLKHYSPYHNQTSHDEKPPKKRHNVVSLTYIY